MYCIICESNYVLLFCLINDLPRFLSQDVQWNDIDYMTDYLDFTYDNKSFKSLPDMVDDLHKNQQKYVMIIDPGISKTQPENTYSAYDEGIEMDIFIKTHDGSGFADGRVWPGDTVFPDFSHPNSSIYWENQLRKYHSLIPFDGVWVDMNEPSSFIDGSSNGCPDKSNKLDYPPYTPRVTGRALYKKTLCPSSQQYYSSHYDMHSLTGLLEMKATRDALVKIRNRRPFVISRSTFPSAGQYGGHWSGDIFSTWRDMKQSITSIINFNLFGVPLVGADICGFVGPTSEELCTRWMQLGAFYPFNRNHNAQNSPGQAPVQFSEEAQGNMRHALMMRYMLLPYLYTLFASAHVNGTTVARGLFAEFPTDPLALKVDEQFMWGSALLITPVLEIGASQVSGYLPSAIWYDLYNDFGKKYISTGEVVQFTAPISRMPLHIKGGSVIPAQYPDLTTAGSRSNPFVLYVARDENGNANGKLFWDDGDTIGTIAKKQYTLVEFHVENSMLHSVVENLPGGPHEDIVVNHSIF